MKKLFAIVLLALSLMGGSRASADSSWFDVGVTWEQQGPSLDAGVTWE
jgi:hypothetical protein